ncbi:P-loop containing nucleoside triphosphate hydrolase protein [Piptocephalis cylindrospora]|uniref:P-loop containing nucleoside triphosphate hydrolase protein n=1 Tax=Piptocephalis cylindrospora TaxID=1907219 RepID=A0A4P9Y8D4_9FUNG|nr:P-loop containing nucleoside triphosphate hydrolase protein [Piptocephalis cylindrospora]|eukprot:RKP15295.1 P-loop containing nucleoside triphosphate hydrolase protein [Piptocephalis cylindrospora]
MPATLGSLLCREDVQVLGRLQPPIRTLEDMMLWPLIGLVEGTNWTHGKVADLRDRVAQALVSSPRIPPGSEVSTSCPGLGCPVLDAALIGEQGLRVGTVTEIVGPAGVGKTQLALTSTAAFLMQDQTRHMVFLDAENTFRPERLYEILKNRRDRHAHVDEDALIRKDMDRVHIAAVRRPKDIAVRLEQVGRWKKQGGIGLIVLDSVAAIYRYLEEKGHSSLGSHSNQANHVGVMRNALTERQGQLGQLASLLKATSQDLEASVLVVNQVTGRGFASTSLSGTGTENGPGGGELGVEAALGHFWCHSITNRIFLSRPDESSGPWPGSIYSLHPPSIHPSNPSKSERPQDSPCRTMRLVKCPYRPTGIEVSYTIALGGVFGREKDR